MILLDINLLVYALDTSSTFHERAQRWLEAQLSGDETVAFAWQVILGFVRLSTQGRFFAAPLSAVEAFDVVTTWLAQPNVIVLQPGRDHGSRVRDLLVGAGAAGNMTNDAHLAALAIEHGATLASCDSDFARFAGLRWRNPLR
ncbi:MAG: type II toxin-antitoxin system VapC family toxin [Acidimicrobiales bacterium]